MRALSNILTPKATVHRIRVGFENNLGLDVVLDLKLYYNIGPKIRGDVNESVYMITRRIEWLRFSGALISPANTDPQS